MNDPYDILPDAIAWLERSRDSKSPSNARLYSEVILREWRAAEQAAAGLSADLSHFGRALQRIADAVEAWANDETPDEDFPFDSDMDFVNFCGHVARSALADV